jgi:hypothetical protein
MPGISPTYIYDILGKQQKPMDEDRLKQTARLNAMGNIFNLIGQAAYGSKGATINPLQDKVTPFILNQFNQSRQLEIAQGEKARAFGLRQLLENDKRQYTEQKDAEKRNFDENKTKEQRTWQEGQNEKYKSTPDQQMERAKVIAGQKSEQELKDYGAKKKADLEYQNEMTKILAERKKTGSPEDKNYLFNVDRYRITKQDVASLAPVINKLANQPEVKERLNKLIPALGVDALFDINELSDSNQSILLNALWPDLKPYYDTFKEETDQNIETKSESKPKIKIIW